MRILRVGRYIVPLWLISVILISGISSIVMAYYVWKTLNIPFEVKEPLEILDYPTQLSLYPGEVREFYMTIRNHATMNYSITLDFQLSNVTYQTNYVTFSSELYSVIPGQQNLTAWFAVKSDAPPINASLTINFKRQSPSSNFLDWTMFHHDLLHSGYSDSIGPTSNTLLWSVKTGNTSERADYSPAISGCKVYTGSTAGKIYCFDALNGQILWSFQTGGEIASCPTVQQGKVYVGSNDGNIYCLNSAEGILIWKFSTAGMVSSSPSLFNGRIYVGSADGNLYCLNASTGQKIWSYNTGPIYQSSAAISDGRVYIIGNYLYCLNAQSGELIWKDTTATGGNASPMISDGFVYAGYSLRGWGRLDCLNALTGVRVWSFTPGAAVCSTPAIANGKVYFGSCDDKMYCVDANTGTEVWSYWAGSYEIRSSPAIAQGLVYFIDHNLDRFNGKVYCLDAASGAVVWSYVTGSEGGWSSPAVAKGIVFVGAGDWFYAIGTILL